MFSLKKCSVFSTDYCYQIPEICPHLHFPSIFVFSSYRFILVSALLANTRLLGFRSCKSTNHSLSHDSVSGKHFLDNPLCFITKKIFFSGQLIAFLFVLAPLQNSLPQFLDKKNLLTVLKLAHSLLIDRYLSFNRNCVLLMMHKRQRFGSVSFRSDDFT